MEDHLIEDDSVEFLLQLSPAMQQDAELCSEKIGISLNQFINDALTEKLYSIQQEEWLRNKKPVTQESKNEFIALLDRAGTEPPQPGDELPEGYVSPFPQS